MSNTGEAPAGEPDLGSLPDYQKAELLLCVVLRQICVLDNLAARSHRVRLEDLRCWSGTAHGALSAAMTKHTACETQ